MGWRKRGVSFGAGERAQPRNVAVAGAVAVHDGSDKMIAYRGAVERLERRGELIHQKQMLVEGMPEGGGHR
jgi:hypothetical protein